jgi:hypothetical protein
VHSVACHLLILVSSLVSDPVFRDERSGQLLQVDALFVACS